MVIGAKPRSCCGGSGPRKPVTGGNMSSVVIVDDNLLIRTLMREILVNGGYAVLGEADNGIAAEARVRGLHPEVVTLDLVMPQRDGLETIPYLLAVDPALTIIVCSASLDQRRVIAALRCGAVGFIVKPFTQQSVAASFDEALHRAPQGSPMASPSSESDFIDPSAVAEADRREFERLAISLAVTITPPVGQAFTASTVDISAGGMLVSTGDLAIDTRVTFRIGLGFGQESVEGQARAVRINQHGQLAFIFERLLIADHERLTAYIAGQCALI